MRVRARVSDVRNQTTQSRVVSSLRNVHRANVIALDSSLLAGCSYVLSNDASVGVVRYTGAAMVRRVNGTLAVAQVS
jgi:hypothetical protein